MTGQACLIDLKIDFDTLNHETLMHKLENYGFEGRKLTRFHEINLKDLF